MHQREESLARTPASPESLGEHDDALVLPVVVQHISLALVSLALVVLAAPRGEPLELGANLSAHEHPPPPSLDANNGVGVLRPERPAFLHAPPHQESSTMRLQSHEQGIALRAV